MSTSNSQRFDVYQAITDQIIAAIEAGAGQPQMPWHQGGASTMLPMNVESGRAYRGINVVTLWTSAHVRGFEHGLWGTYRQWQERGAQVRKGEKSSYIVFYKEFERDDEDGHGDDDSRQRIYMAKASTVFNVAQVDGYSIPSPVQPLAEIEIVNKADAAIAATKADIRVGGCEAYFSPMQDYIAMPDRRRFTGTGTSTATEGWYSTLFHELTHWSGHDSRLNRDLSGSFGDEAYAVEELVAELGAAFLCAELGVRAVPRPDHAAYIDHWLRVMKGDKKAIFAAASAASKAVSYVTSLGPVEIGAA